MTALRTLAAMAAGLVGCANTAHAEAPYVDPAEDHKDRKSVV